MRCREWYGWHFPEMTKITSDNIQYAKAVVFMGTRDQAQGLDLKKRYGRCHSHTRQPIGILLVHGPRCCNTVKSLKCHCVKESTMTTIGGSGNQFGSFLFKQKVELCFSGTKNTKLGNSQKLRFRQLGPNSSILVPLSGVLGNNLGNKYFKK